MKIFTIVLLICLNCIASHATENQKFEASNSNGNIINLGNDLVFISTHNEQGLAYIQNIKTLEIVKEVKFKDLYWGSNKKLPDGNLLISNDRKLDTKTLEIKNYPLSNFFDVFLKYKNNKTLALNYYNFCIFDLTEGCVSREIELPSSMPIGHIYKLAEDDQAATLIVDTFGTFTFIKFQKNDLSWKEIAVVPLPDNYSKWLSIMSGSDTALLLVTSNDYYNPKPSILYSIDLKTGQVKENVLEQAFASAVFMKVEKSQLLIFGEISSGCWGQCPYSISQNVVLDLNTLKKVKDITTNFAYRDVISNPTTYKNTPQLNTFVSMPNGQLIVIGSDYYQAKNFNEWFSFQTLQFTPIDSSAVIKNICDKHARIILTLKSMSGRWCSDISTTELSTIQSFDLSGVRGFPLIENLQEKDFEGFTNLKELDLSNNNLLTLDDSTLARLNGLIYLDLHGNKISDVEQKRIKAILPSTTIIFY